MSPNNEALERRTLLPGPKTATPESRPNLRDLFSQDSPPLSARTSDGAVHGSTSDIAVDLPVYTNIHRIRRDIISVVEDYLSVEQLRDVRLNITVVRPLVDKLYELNDISIVYCLLVNRAQFILDQDLHSNRHNVNFTRATLCELIATRVLRRFSDQDDGPSGLLFLARILITGFEPFLGAPGQVRCQARHKTSWSSHKTMPALEVAILTQSKFFLSSTPCMKVIDSIYVGKIVYTPSSFLNLIPDHYKQKPISLYDPREAPLLNQYRLIVPRTRNILELVHFLILFLLYMALMAYRDPNRFTVTEMAFFVYSFGWVLDLMASILEHGWSVYTQNLWSFLDVAFTFIYLVYASLRLYSWHIGSIEPAQQALDVLALGALVLVPRLAFNLLSDNLVFLSLRSMMSDFSLLTALSVWCSFGFLLSLYWLGNGIHMPLTIGKWMLWIWFGLEGIGIQRSVDFHWLLGPCVMVTFAFLGNTLFLTILVSMLSNTFSNIASNATAEIAYRRAVLTFEGVKSDAVFSYMPPFNLLAVFVLIPLRFLVDARWFHKIHVATVRLINLPTLLIIAIAERRLLGPATSGSASGRDDGEANPGTSSSFSRPRPQSSSVWNVSHWFWRDWQAHREIRTVFDLPPPAEVEDDIAVDDELTRHLIRRQFAPATVREHSSGPSKPSDSRSLRHRRDSTFTGIAPKLRMAFSNEDENDKNSASLISRLESLEASMVRMEALLVRLIPPEEEALGSPSSRPTGIDGEAGRSANLGNDFDGLDELG